MDQKTHLLIGTVGILIPLIIGLIGSVDSEKNPYLSSLSILIYIISIIMLIISFGFCIHVIIARSPEAPNTHFFGLDIIQESQDEYLNTIKVFELADQIQSYSIQSYTLGKILKKKFSSYNIGVYFLIAGIVLLLSSFFLLILESIFI